MGSFERMATVTASTKRPPAIVDGERGDPATNLASISILPLMPADPKSAVVERAGLGEAAMELLVTYADGALDIREGDTLVVSGVDYPIRAVGDWTWRSSQYKELYVEEIKQR
jgi:hypothetical protein